MTLYTEVVQQADIGQPTDIIGLALDIGSLSDWITPVSALTADFLFGYTIIGVPTVPGIAPIQIIWYLQENDIGIVGAGVEWGGEWLCMAVDDPERAHSLTEWCWG